MPASDIVIRGAREHNLRDVDLILPRNELICLTGVSGSGKSSLAFDTVYAEGQRRYVESLSSFARQFLGQMPKPDVDFIGGLSPSISISQKSTGNNPRSTVGTITEIYDYLRVLFARVGQGFCYKCGREITAQTRDQIIAKILELEKGTQFSVLAPLIRAQKGEHRDLFEDLLKQGFVRARVDGTTVSLSDDQQLDRQMRHNIEVVVDRLSIKPDVRTRLSEAVEIALKMGDGSMIVELDATMVEGAPRKSTGRASKKRGVNVNDLTFSVDYACTHCGISFEPPTPQLFSFNSPQGMCLECDGLGHLYSFDPELLVPNTSKSFKQGCFELVGTWKEMGRWRRHIYQGVADTYERIEGLDEGTLLETPWEELTDALREVWLWGTGDTHITFTWRGGSAPMKYGGNFEGIIPDLLTRYHNLKNKAHQRKLEEFMNTIDCGSCHGQRLNRHARHFKLTSSDPVFSEHGPLSLPDICQLSIDRAEQFFGNVALDATRTRIASEALKEIRARLGFLMNVGLDYLTLNRTAPTLSGGESQRIRLAGQIGSGLVGVLYILDEPSIGLHPRDNDRLLSSLCRLRDLGNTVIVVEHDEDTMLASDRIIDFGPGPGVRGGEIVYEGDPAAIDTARKSVTGDYLSGKKEIEIPTSRRAPGENRLVIRGARHNNLKDVTVDIPLGCFVCVTGVSGSGKSSLINDILVEALRRDLNRGNGEPGAHDAIEGLELLDKLIAIDQTPIGRTPRSNPGTYIKLFDDIRSLFTQMPESKRRGYKPGRFSFNVKSGRCEACEGNGSNRLEMDFLADVWVTCPVCDGHRFNRETLQVKFKENSISDVLEMDVQQALDFFENVPKITHKLQTLHDVGLDYLKIGQPSPTLSGGEAQRIKLAKELVKKSTGQTLYLLDEPTTGLHFADIQLLLSVLQNFVKLGNTVLVVEHNLDVIKTADWIIDLGPEGGAGGGEVIATGPPEEIAKCKRSHTGQALAKLFQRTVDRSQNTAATKVKRVRKKQATLAKKITVQGASQHNLKSVDASIERDKMTVFCGPSGSGKSSLAMDTIYAEGQRRYVESLSSYARQFVNQMQKPKLDHIEGLSPAIAIEQKNLGSTPRSTVGTVTEIYDYLRILMARLATPHCPDCEIPVGTQTSDEITDKVMAHDYGTRLYLMAPIEVASSGDYDALWEEIQAAGFVRLRVDGKTHAIDDLPKIDRRRKHNIEVIVDRIVVKPESRGRIAESVESTLALGKGVLRVAYPLEEIDELRWDVVSHSQHLACDRCGRSFDRLTPHNFSFNSQLGWCPSCEGLGTQVGANPATLLKDSKLTLAEGALSLWPNLGHPVSKLMLESLSRETGVPLDVPFEEFHARWRRVIMHGTGDQWIDVYKSKDKSSFLFRFQYKGVYPALEEASRISPTFRSRLESYVDQIECSACSGSRLRDDASASRFKGNTVDDLCRFPLGKLQKTVQSWKLDQREKKIAGEVLREIENRLQFLNDVGLEYLSLSRGAATLSNGEAQRIRLASQLGSGLCGVLYVLDEPTIGLHPRDNRRLLEALKKLRDLGNTLLVVEHDKEVIEEADAICDFGPGAGREGGQIVAHGTPQQIARRRASVTGPYISGKKGIPIPTDRRHVQIPGANGTAKPKRAVKKKGVKTRGGKTNGSKNEKRSADSAVLEVLGARQHNLKNIDVVFPLGALTVVTGPSGCGKSSLVEDILFNSLAKTLHRASALPGAHDEIRGLQHINKVIRVDQQPIGNSPTSNPATYTGAFELIRMLYAQLPDAKVRGYTPRRFSFNVAGGRCEDCEGNGQKRIEMHFLPDVWIECETCRGQRYNEETLAVKFHGRSISDILDMTCAQAVQIFENIPKIRRILQTLCDVGLEYLTLGQPAPTLSGGEAQRVKLASELSRPDTGRTLYLLDEPTTGLHFDDLAKLLEVLHRLVDMGNTVILIEHNLDVIKQADWVIDMGPEAGMDGGQVVTCGTPEQIVEYAQTALKQKGSRRKLDRSYTGEALVDILEAGPYRPRQVQDSNLSEEKESGELDITEVGKLAKMPWEADGRQWHTRDRVGRSGEAVRWDGRILEKVVSAIEKREEFLEPDFNSRTVVEITGTKKSLGWFFHALTAETWLLKMKFRVNRGTFKKQELIERLPLKTLNEMDELPIYGNQPRVKCKNAYGPWQEIEIRAYTLEEIDTPEFWIFLDEAIDGFLKKTDSGKASIEDQMPWKKLGQKWHFLRKGFTLGKKVEWEVPVLEELVQVLTDAAPQGQFLWNNQVLVHLIVPGQREPWATIQTKKCDAVYLTLNGPKDAVSLGEMTQIARNRWLDATHREKDVVSMEFKTVEDIYRGDLAAFLEKHVQSIAGQSV